MGRCSFASNSKRHREKHGAFFSQKIVADDDRLRRERIEFVVGFGWKRYWIYRRGSCMGAQDSHASGAANVSHQIKKGHLRVSFFYLVPVVGVEPTRYCYHRILSPARLPIPPYRHGILSYYTIVGDLFQVKNSIRCPQPVKRGGGGQVFGWNRRKRSDRIIQDFEIHSLNKCKNTSIIGENHRKAAE